MEMTTDNKLTLIAIIGVTIIFLGLDYHILQYQDLNTIIENATIVPIPALSPSPNCEIQQYKLLENVDECKLNTYTKDGWIIHQAGSVIEQSGRGIDCSTISPVSIDWVILKRDRTNPACL